MIRQCVLVLGSAHQYVRGTRYEVRGTRYKVQGTRYNVQGTIRKGEGKGEGRRGNERGDEERRGYEGREEPGEGENERLRVAYAVSGTRKRGAQERRQERGKRKVLICKNGHVSKPHSGVR